MPKKLKLNIDFGSDFTLIAVSCSKPNFWLAMQLNDVMKFDLRRKEDMPYYHPLLKTILHYVLFYFEDSNNGNTCFLIGNYNQDGKLFPEFRTVDYFLMINGTIGKETTDMFVSGIKGIKGVLTAYEADKSKIKDLKNFIADLELHMIQQIKPDNN